MGDKKYKYDVAISFAEEDKEIAERIAKSCEKLGLKPYFYEDESAENWGENLFNIIVNRYRDTARFALILISQHYIKKRWANIERQIIQGVTREQDTAYLLPLRLDNTDLPGLTDNTLFMDWRENQNPEKVAESIKLKIKSLKKSSKKSRVKPEENSCQQAIENKAKIEKHRKKC